MKPGLASARHGILRSDRGFSLAAPGFFTFPLSPFYPLLCASFMIRGIHRHPVRHPGRLVALQPIGAGNVNDTYRVILRTTFSEEQFILQRINRAVFKDPVAVMANMKAVTDHAHRRIEAEADQADRIWQLPRVIRPRTETTTRPTRRANTGAPSP